jgi:hypothetical protein
MPKIRRPWERRKRTASTNKPAHGVANGQIDDFENEKKELKQEEQPDEASNYLVSLTKADKKEFETKLNEIHQPLAEKKYEMIPIWTIEDADGQPKGKVSESPETQGRFRKYAEQGTSILVMF